MDGDNLVLVRRQQRRRRRRRRCELVLVVEARSCHVRLQVLSADGKIAPDPGLLFSRTAFAVRRDVPGRFGSTSKDATDGCLDTYAYNHLKRHMQPHASVHADRPKYRQADQQSDEQTDRYARWMGMQA
jgi:hypothetical protein